MTRLYAALGGLLAIAALLTGAFVKGHHAGYDSGVNHCATVITRLDGKSRDACGAAVATITARYDAERAQFQADAKAKEAAHARDMAAAKAKFDKEMSDAQADSDRTIADLRAGALRLRRRWQCPRVATAAGVPTPGAGGPGAAGAADDRGADPGGTVRADADESAARIVKYAAQADARIRALQRIVLDDRQ